MKADYRKVQKWLLPLEGCSLWGWLVLFWISLAAWAVTDGIGSIGRGVFFLVFGPPVVIWAAINHLRAKPPTSPQDRP
jgi:hypothetical protein